MKKATVLIRAAPYGMASAGEGFRGIIGLGGLGVETHAVLMDDGVFVAKKGQNPSKIEMQKLEDAYKAVSDFGAKLYIHKESAEVRQVSQEETVEAEWIDTPKLRELINSVDVVVSFV